MANSADRTYLSLLQELVDKSEKGIRADRTNIGTSSIFGKQVTFNLKDGFPLLTSKKMFLKSIIAESLWFMKGSNDIRELSNMTYGIPTRKTVWSDNCKEAHQLNPERFNGFNLGNMYGIAWRKKPCTPYGHTYIKKRTFIDNNHVEVHIKPKLDVEYKNTQRVKTSKFGDIEIIGLLDNKTVIKFLNSGSYRIVKKVVHAISDYFAPTINNIGYLGGKIPDNATAKHLFSVWKRLIKHDVDKVCPRWFNFTNFLNDCYCLEGFQEYVDSNYINILDIEYYGSGIYSPETAIFITKELRDNLQKFEVFEYDGKFFYNKSGWQSAFEKSKNADNIKQLFDNGELLLRPIIHTDQFDNAVNDIKNTPQSRRIVIDAWNERKTSNAVLGICHPMFQFYVDDGELSCKVFIRSNDAFLGMPYNIASYAFITHAVALECNLGVGELIYSIGDLHLYSNHIEQAKEQLSRPMINVTPKLHINNFTNIYDISVDDVSVIDYEPHGKIVAEMAV